MRKRFKRIYIEITNICNLKCEFCLDNNRVKEYMTVNNFENVLDKISKYTDYIYLHVKGEPLLHPNLKEILETASKYNLYVNITTNGTLLDKQYEVLKNSKAIRQINISLHSVEQNADMHIDKQQYIQTVIQCANELNENNGTYISYRIWDMDDIQKDKKYIIDILQDVYNIDITSILVDNSSVKLKKGIYLNVDNVFEWPSMEHEIVSLEGSCYGLKEQIAILVDGTVVPCCLDQQGDIALGNVFEQDFESIITSEVVSKMLEGFRCNRLVQPLCQRCGFRVNKRK